MEESKLTAQPSVNHAVLIYSGNFCPITMNHIKYLEFVMAKLSDTYLVDRVYLVPVSDSVLKKKFNGSTPIDDDDRIGLINALI